MIWVEPDGATPLSPDELAELRVGFVRTRSDLNELETSAIATDLLLKSLGSAAFDWGAADLESVSTVRRNYIEALRAADSGDMAPLLGFVRSATASS